jgi:c-di-GMP-binding flagellar brake protein YcgR
MPILEELDEAQLAQTVREAAKREVRLVVTVSTEGGWLNYNSQVVSLRGTQVWVRPPTCDLPRPMAALTLGQSVHLTFKLDNHKYTCNSAVVQRGHLPIADDPKAPVLALSLPTAMQRIQRRVSPRLDVADDQLAPACFWLGDAENEPGAPAPDRPVWLGRLLDFGTQGLKVLADRNCTEVFESGDHVGLRFSFGPGEQPLYADAFYRHYRPDERDEQKVMMGFQFAERARTPQACLLIETLRRKVAEYQRQATGAAAEQQR